MYRAILAENHSAFDLGFLKRNPPVRAVMRHPLFRRFLSLGLADLME
jgi:hypothetical protein